MNWLLLFVIQIIQVVEVIVIIEVIVDVRYDQLKWLLFDDLQRGMAAFTDDLREQLNVIRVDRKRLSALRTENSLGRLVHRYSYFLGAVRTGLLGVEEIWWTRRGWVLEVSNADQHLEHLHRAPTTAACAGISIILRHTGQMISYILPPPQEKTNMDGAPKALGTRFALL
jgi:hypothetical protein